MSGKVLDGTKEMSISCLIEKLDSLAEGEEALRKMGQSAIRELIRAALNPLPDRDRESPSSLLRRTSAVRILADIGLSTEQWAQLNALIDEPAPEILIAVCRIAKQVGDEKSVLAVANRLTKVIGHVDWYLLDKIADMLVDIYETARPLIERTIAAHRRLPLEAQLFDVVLLALTKVKQKVGESS